MKTVILYLIKFRHLAWRKFGTSWYFAGNVAPVPQKLAIDISKTIGKIVSARYLVATGGEQK